MNQEQPNKLFGPEEAAEYLREKWNLPSFSVDAFKQYRYRLRKANRSVPSPLAGLSNSSVWTKEQLDAMPTPNTARRRQQGNENSPGLDRSELTMLSFA